MPNPVNNSQADWKTEKSMFKNAPIYFALDAGFVRTNNNKKYKNFNNDPLSTNNETPGGFKNPGVYPKVRFNNNKNFSQSQSQGSMGLVVGQTQGINFKNNEKFSNGVNNLNQNNQNQEKSYYNNKINRESNFHLQSERKETEGNNGTNDTHSHSHSNTTPNFPTGKSIRKDNFSNNNFVVQNNNKIFLEKGSYPSPGDNRAYAPNNFPNMKNNFFMQPTWGVNMINPSQNFNLMRNSPNPHMNSNIPPNMYFFDPHYINNMGNSGNINNINSNANNPHISHDMLPPNYNEKNYKNKLFTPDRQTQNTSKNIHTNIVNNNANIKENYIQFTNNQNNYNKNYNNTRSYTSPTKDSSNNTTTNNQYNNGSFLIVSIKLLDNDKLLYLRRGEDYFKKASDFCIKNKLNPILIRPIFNHILNAVESIDKVMLHNVTKDEHRQLEHIQKEYEDYKVDVDLERLNISCITIIGESEETNILLDNFESKDRLSLSF
jgi:hypothetical protein